MKKMIRLSSFFAGFFAGNIAFIRQGEYFEGLSGLAAPSLLSPFIP